MRARNRAPRIPPVTVRLGTVLELVTRQGAQHTTWEGIEGYQLATDADATERKPGYARLYLWEGKDPEPSDDDEKLSLEALETYAAWHDRAPDGVEHYDVPADFDATPVGRALRLDYASDKWCARGELTEYTHDFTEGSPPLVYVDDRERPRAFVLVGGSMTVTPRGIA